MMNFIINPEQHASDVLFGPVIISFYGMKRLKQKPARSSLLQHCCPWETIDLFIIQIKLKKSNVYLQIKKLN